MVCYETTHCFRRCKDGRWLKMNLKWSGSKLSRPNPVTDLIFSWNLIKKILSQLSRCPVEDRTEYLPNERVYRYSYTNVFGRHFVKGCLTLLSEELWRQWAVPCHNITRIKSFLFRVSDVEIGFILQSDRWWFAETCCLLLSWRRKQCILSIPRHLSGGRGDITQ
jgi:hypothetical protein